MVRRPRLGFIGVGRVGRSLAIALKNQGYYISAIYRRDRERLNALAQELQTEAVSSPLAVAQRADLIFIAVPDDMITVVVNQLRSTSLDTKGVVHLSGVHTAHLLSPLEQIGAMTGAWHPAWAFTADKTLTADDWKQVVFALDTSDAVLQQWLDEVSTTLGARVIHIHPNDKTRYHLALVFASNYVVTLYALGQNLLDDIGVEPALAKQALDSVMGSAIANLKQMPPAQALTGPLVRGDVGTIRRHLDALADYPQLLLLYCQLAQATKMLLQKRGLDTSWLDKLLNEVR